MRVFALAIGCKKQDTSKTTTFSRVAYCAAVSNEEAVGKGLSLAFENWPYSGDYTDHWSISLEIPIEFFNTVIASEETR